MILVTERSVTMTQQNIIDAALKVWGRELYQNTSLADVAQELGVSKPALYRHFASKEKLLDAMYDRFVDEYAAHIIPDFEKAVGAQDLLSGIVIILRSMTDYFARNRDLSVFALLMVYGHRRLGRVGESLKRLGFDTERLNRYGVYNRNYPTVMQMVTSTLTLFMAIFHRLEREAGTPPTEDEIEALKIRLETALMNGLGLERGAVDALDYAALEGRLAAEPPQDIDDGNILEAVASAVAEAGPWDASMEMVARNSGLSKSGLYAHFKSKQDMVRQLFITEMSRIISFAGAAAALSEQPEEQLYMGIYAIAGYLRRKPEILIALNWLKTRRPEMGPQEGPPSGFFRVFRDVKLPALGWGQDMSDDRETEADHTTYWILFLIVNMLMQWPLRQLALKETDVLQTAEAMNYSYKAEDFYDLPNESVRRLYRFITLGLKGCLS